MTHIFKDRYGKWRAETRFDLDDNRVLEIHTRKTERGELVTYATVSTVANGYKTHRVFQDYSKCLAADKVRCDAKNVVHQHDKVLSMIDTLRADISRHYNDEPALVA